MKIIVKLLLATIATSSFAQPKTYSFGREATTIHASSLIAQGSGRHSNGTVFVYDVFGCADMKGKVIVYHASKDAAGKTSLLVMGDLDWDGSQHLRNEFSRMMQDICIDALMGAK